MFSLILGLGTQYSILTLQTYFSGVEIFEHLGLYLWHCNTMSLFFLTNHVTRTSEDLKNTSCCRLCTSNRSCTYKLPMFLWQLQGCTEWHVSNQRIKSEVRKATLAVVYSQESARWVRKSCGIRVRRSKFIPKCHVISLNLSFLTSWRYNSPYNLVFRVQWNDGYEST